MLSCFNQPLSLANRLFWKNKHGAKSTSDSSGQFADCSVFLFELSWPYCSWDSHYKPHYINPWEIGEGITTTKTTTTTMTTTTTRTRSRWRRAAPVLHMLLFCSAQVFSHLFIFFLFCCCILITARKKRLFFMLWSKLKNVMKMLWCYCGTCTCTHERKSAERQ